MELINFIRRHQKQCYAIQELQVQTFQMLQKMAVFTTLSNFMLIISKVFET